MTQPIEDRELHARTCPFCQFTYCTDIEEDRAAHRKYRREYLRVFRPQPEPRLAVYREGDIRVDASSDYLISRLVGQFRPSLPAFSPRLFPSFPALVESHHRQKPIVHGSEKAPEAN